MMSRLAALFSALALVSTLSLSPVAAQAPTEGSMIAAGSYLFVFHDGILYKVDQRTLAVLGSVELASAQIGRPGIAMTPPPPPPPEMVPVEIAETVEVTETVVDEAESVADPRADADRKKAAGRAKRAGAAIDRALQWLVEHQDESGRWDSDEFMKHDLSGKPCTGPGSATQDVGVTGLATLALLGNGNTLRRGPYKDQVKSAVKWLRGQQHENGLIGTNAAHDFVYGHAIATVALSEAYGLSRYKLLRNNVQSGINYLETHRNPYSVWRYQPRDNDNDTSVTTWALMAYRSAQSFGLDVNPTALDLVATWYDQVSDPSGRHGYSKQGEVSSRMPGDHMTRFPPKNGEAMTAAALFGRFLLDQEPNDKPIMKKAAQVLLGKPPKWAKGHIDPYYWWFGTQAMFQIGGEAWGHWRKYVPVLMVMQRTDGNAAGSWDPIGVWDVEGGRVYATAMHTLTLQVLRREAALVR